MNSENFAEYIKNPSMLYQLSYQELKSLSMQYPYCLNLHYLLLEKSRLDQHRDWPKNLERAAAYSIDRTYLFHKLRQDELPPTGKSDSLAREDFLELQDFTQLEKKLQKIPLSENLPEEQPDILHELPPLPTAEEAPRQPLFYPEEDDDDEDDLTEASIFGDSLPEQLYPELETTDEEQEIIPETAFPVSDIPILPGEDIPEVQNIGDLSDEPEKADFVWELAGQPSAFSPEPETIDRLAAACRIIEAINFPEPAPAPSFQQPSPKAVLSDPSPAVLSKKPGKEAAPRRQAPAPTPSSEFQSWKDRYQPTWKKTQTDKPAKAVAPQPPEKIKSTPLKKKKKKKSSKKDRVIQIAERSITESYDIATETLAELLAAQTQYERAIAMYERLCLILPDKREYFHKRIEELKRLK
jgi:hypothetical protein